MLIHKKKGCIFCILLGIFIALGNAYLFVSKPAAWQGLMFLVGIGWIWVGASNLRRLQKTDLQ
jgi:hypothetical protein